MSEQQISFQQLTIKEWQQFDCIDLAFHDRLTILTGANGSGKTTILKLLAQHHDRWQFHTVSTPKKDLRTGTMNFCPRLFHGEDKSHDLDIGEIIYTNRKSSSLSILDSGAKEYSVEISSWQSIELIFIPSHRSVFRYESIMELPVGKKEKRQSFNEINNLDKQHYQQVSLGQLHKHSGSFFMKRDLIAWAIQGYGIKNGAEEIIMNDDKQVKYYEDFQEILRKILPESLGFKKFQIRGNEIVFICNDGNDEFVFEKASGGISSLIDMAWRIYTYSRDEEFSFTVLIDEVENHLHPTMQREVLPAFLEAFPQAKFIVSTHSPLIIGSVADSNVYALRYNDRKKIESHKLDLVNKAKNASEILHEVLGVSFTMPIWAEQSLNEITAKYSSRVNPPKHKTPKLPSLII